MKKILILGLIIYCANAFSQDETENFPGKHVEMLIGKELKVKELDKYQQIRGYEGFYSKLKLEERYDKDKKLTKYEALVGKVFKVIKYDSYTYKIANVVEEEKYILTLENLELGTVYFYYDPLYSFKFPFEIIGGLEYPKGFFCKDIEEKKDKFTSEITYNSPLNYGISVIKKIKENVTDLYLYIEVNGSSASVDKQGVVLLLENGLKIERPTEKINVRVYSNKYTSGYTYSAIVHPDTNELKLLTQFKITDVRLYIYDSQIVYGNKLIEYLKCIIDK